MIKLAIDFGTAETKIYRLGSGIVLAEATCLSVQKDTARTATRRSAFWARRRNLPKSSFPCSRAIS